MSDDNAEAEAERRYPMHATSSIWREQHNAGYQAFLAGAEWGRASRDAEVAALEDAVFANEHGCESAESEAEAERTRADKAQIRAYNEITRADYTPESIEAAIGKLWRAAVASRDAEVADAREQLALQGAERREDRAALERRVESERTRADEAETSLTNLEAGFKAFMRSHNQVLDENERLREVIERASVELHRALPTSRRAAMVILDMAAIPVEPQGDRPHYEIIVPGCDCVGCFGETPDHENGSD